MSSVSKLKTSVNSKATQFKRYTNPNTIELESTELESSIHLKVQYYLITLDNTVTSNGKHTLEEYTSFELIQYTVSGCSLVETNPGNHRAPPTLSVLEIFKSSKHRDKQIVEQLL